MIFFENKLLLQPDKDFDPESNGRNSSSLAPPGGEKKLFSFFFLQNDLLKAWAFFADFFSRHQVALES